MKRGPPGQEEGREAGVEEGGTGGKQGGRAAGWGEGSQQLMLREGSCCCQGRQTGRQAGRAQPSLGPGRQDGSAPDHTQTHHTDTHPASAPSISTHPRPAAAHRHPRTQHQDLLGGHRAVAGRGHSQATGRAPLAGACGGMAGSLRHGQHRGREAWCGVRLLPPGGRGKTTTAATLRRFCGLRRLTRRARQAACSCRSSVFALRRPAYCARAGLATQLAVAAGLKACARTTREFMVAMEQREGDLGQCNC